MDNSRHAGENQHIDTKLRPMLGLRVNKQNNKIKKLQHKVEERPHKMGDEFIYFHSGKVVERPHQIQNGRFPFISILVFFWVLVAYPFHVVAYHFPALSAVL
jgi:hypothetical protein